LPSRKIPNAWPNQECWIIGGGASILEQFNVPWEIRQQAKQEGGDPSIISPYLAPIHGKNVIGVNSAYQLGDWVDVLFFGEKRWYEKHEQALKDHPAWKVTVAPQLDKTSGLTYLEKDSYKKRGISITPDRIAWNLNSGAASISLAYHLGATRIILLGFDMGLDDDQDSHWFGRHYEINGENLTKARYVESKYANFKRHIRAFPAVADDAQRLGLTIINASPNSKIEDLPKCSVSELLEPAEALA